MAKDDGACHDDLSCATGFLTLADLANDVGFGDHAGQQSIGTAHDHKIGMEIDKELRRVNEWSIIIDFDEPLACRRQYCFHEHQVILSQLAANQTLRSFAAITAPTDVCLVSFDMRRRSQPPKSIRNVAKMPAMANPKQAKRKFLGTGNRLNTVTRGI